MHLNIRNFAVINSVGAVSLRATLNCDAFATEHSGESHFDRSSFVGLAVNFVWIRTLYTSTLGRAPFDHVGLTLSVNSGAPHENRYVARFTPPERPSEYSLVRQSLGGVPTLT